MSVAIKTAARKAVDEENPDAKKSKSEPLPEDAIQRELRAHKVSLSCSIMFFFLALQSQAAGRTWR